MKILSREFTRTEKILLVLLSLLLVGLAYYKFVDQTVRNSVFSSRSEAQALQTELDMVMEKTTRLRSLQGELDQMKEEGKLSYMPSYNSSKEEIAFLNDILATTEKYSVAFAEVTRSGAQIRRSFTLQYVTKNYRAAKEIMEKLCASKNRCRVGDIRCQIAENGETTINAAATFYETMEGGTPDAGLPSDSAVVNQ